MTEVQKVNCHTKICVEKMLFEDSALPRENQDTVNRRLNLKKQFGSACSCHLPRSVDNYLGAAQSLLFTRTFLLQLSIQLLKSGNKTSSPTLSPYCWTNH